ncbi:hypothetical protein HNP46_006481 [Pseudomonas nitritireducens]|uniref:Uncharacterized protein n=1 Tax=Pseudomonas nitroreducens TaxID=46680 RepID=A0A7W7KRE2_PSENT|nr:hypothetical protein [Pseudomonas nitritireducens]MBB4867567.1 hypothetical protein [Pseudomonas nitritireducens]
MNSHDLNKLLKNPRAMMQFRASGRVPQREEITSPLITLLKSIHPRELLQITNVKVGLTVGYTGIHPFQNAAQALNWLCPANPGHSEPSVACRDLSFRRRLTIDDLARIASVPDNVRSEWNARNPSRTPSSGFGLD